MEPKKFLYSDITNLWEMFCSLDQDHRRQFLQAASMWQQALSHWSEESTLSYALTVVACEALKQPGPQHRDSNIYDVVEALLGTVVAEQLQEQWFRPQGVRNSHLHAGEFSGGEFVKGVIMSSYHDPTFDDTRRALAKIAQASIMEWLILGGEMTMPGNKMRIN